jgi:hypothetical protein
MNNRDLTYSDRQRKCHRRALYLLRPSFWSIAKLRVLLARASVRANGITAPGALDRTLLCRSRTRRLRNSTGGA